ncbi:MAG: hypothetical protein U5R48_19580 [Gammaproteobacteria bacterium]|nr:hypothetical protein [Gammaproteobacteria bacterium]
MLITETQCPAPGETSSYFGEGRRGPSGLPVPAAAARAARPGDLRQRSADALGSVADARHPAGCTFLNFTASHDGIGLRPAEGLLSAGGDRGSWWSWCTGSAASPRCGPWRTAR